MLQKRLERMQEVISRRQKGVAILLENVYDPHNISAVMRSMDAVGVQDLFVLQTEGREVKKWSKKSSASAMKWISVHNFSDTNSCVQTIRKQYANLVCAYLDTQSTSLFAIDLTEPVVLVFGNEKRGISKELHDLCDSDFIIPQQGMVHSLNISVACAVSLYELFRQRTARNQLQPISPKAQQTLLNQWVNNHNGNS